jgi:hypothetical protein
MRFTRLLGVALAATLASACWHATITTGRPAGTQVIQEDWHTNWFFGLIPGDEVNTSACKSGIAKVETQHSFLNILVNAFVGIIWSPMTITVTCASGGTSSLAPADKVVGHAGSTRAEATTSFKAAAQLAAETGNAVYVKF